MLFLNSGAEAVENAVKIARKYTKRPGIIAFSKGFHGRTLMTMTMTSKVKPYKFGFGPFAPEVYKAPFPYEYRRPEGLTEEQYDDFIIEEFKNFFISEVAPETIAAVVMEPVQGEGGLLFQVKICSRSTQHYVQSTEFYLYQMKFKQDLVVQDNTSELNIMMSFQI